MRNFILTLLVGFATLTFCTGCEEGNGDSHNQIHRAVVANKIYKPKRTEGHYYSRNYDEEYYLQLRPLSDDGTIIYKYSTVQVTSYDYNSCQLGDTIKFGE